MGKQINHYLHVVYSVSHISQSMFSMAVVGVGIDNRERGWWVKARELPFNPCRGSNWGSRKERLCKVAQQAVNGCQIWTHVPDSSTRPPALLTPGWTAETPTHEIYSLLLRRTSLSNKLLAFSFQIFFPPQSLFFCDIFNLFLIPLNVSLIFSFICFLVVLGLGCCVWATLCCGILASHAVSTGSRHAGSVVPVAWA